jgi:hypothetical protein
MLLGMNMGYFNTWSGNYPFTNIILNMAGWDRYSGTGAYKQSWGTLDADVPTDEFRAHLCDHDIGVKAGWLTVWNPSRGMVAWGTWSNPGAYYPYSDAEFATFWYPADGNSIFTFCRGSLGKDAGPLVLLIDGVTLEEYQGGRIWNPDFIEFYRGLDLDTVRFMDPVGGAGTLDEEWPDRVTPDRITFGSQMPLEYIVDFCNLLQVDPMTIMPVRASPDYATKYYELLHSGKNSVGTIGCTGLDAARVLYHELSNEVWNYAGPYAASTQWVEFLPFTRIDVRVDAATGILAWPAHGFVANDHVRFWSTKESRANGADDELYWEMSKGGQVFVHSVIDADHIRVKVYDWSDPYVFPPQVVSLLGVNPNEPGKVRDMNMHYAALSVRNWGLADAVFGPGRVRALMGAQAGNSWTTQERMNKPGAERADYALIAPYYHGEWQAAQADVAVDQVTPRYWCNHDMTVHIGVYAQGAGAAKTDDELIAGVGALGSGKQTMQYTHAWNGQYASGTPITGLTRGGLRRRHERGVPAFRGPAFELVFLAIPNHPDGDSREGWRLSAPIIPGSTGVVDIMDSFANQALRNVLNQCVVTDWVTQHAAVSQGKPIALYEFNMHLAEPGPAAAAGWLKAYQESPEFADVLETHLYMLASRKVKTGAYYADVTGTTFSLATSYADRSDKRYVRYAGFGGIVLEMPPVKLDDQQGEVIASEPASYPVRAAQLEPGFSYQIVGGDRSRNFAVSGDMLVMVNGNGIDWGVGKQHGVKLLKTDSYTYDAGIVTVTTGAA